MHPSCILVLSILLQFSHSNKIFQKLDFRLLDDILYYQLVIDIPDFEISLLDNIFLSHKSNKCYPALILKPLSGLKVETCYNEPINYKLIKNPNTTFFFWNDLKKDPAEIFNEALFATLPCILPTQPYFFVASLVNEQELKIEEVQVYGKILRQVVKLINNESEWTIEDSSYQTIYNRRNNFYGTKIKVYYDGYKPHAYLDEHGNFQGYNGKLGSLLADKLNLSLELKAIENWGLVTKDGQITGSIKDIYENVFQIGMANYFLIPERLALLDGGFTTGVWVTELFYWKFNDFDFIYGSVYDLKFWITVILSGLVSTLYFVLAYRWKYGTSDTFLNQSLKALGSNLKSFLCLDTDMGQSSLSIRIHLLSISICGAILFWSFSGVLVSYFTSDSEAPPIESLEDLVNVPYLKVFVIKDTSVHQQLIRALHERPGLEEEVSKNIKLYDWSELSQLNEDFKASKDKSQGAFFGDSIDVLPRYLHGKYLEHAYCIPYAVYISRDQKLGIDCFSLSVKIIDSLSL